MLTQKYDFPIIIPFSHYYNVKCFMRRKFLSRQLETFWETVHTMCLKSPQQVNKSSHSYASSLQSKQSIWRSVILTQPLREAARESKL